MTLTMPYDLYGRNASKFNHMINDFDDEVWLEKKSEHRRCNAKSVLALLSLGVEENDEVVIITNSERHDRLFNKIITGITDE